MKAPANFLVALHFMQPFLGWLVALSILFFVLSLILIPWFVGKLPEDFFLKLYRNDRSNTPPSIGAMLLAIFRNALGLLLLLVGIVMLFLPGQGLLTILLGVLLVSFPGKQKLVQLLVCRPKIQHGMDWLRKKRGKSPFFWPRPPNSL